MADLGQELAVTKNDIKHLEADMREIKDGIEKIHSSISSVYDRMDEKFVRKEDFKEHVDLTEKKFTMISNRSNMILGSFITLLVSGIVALVSSRFK